MSRDIRVGIDVGGTFTHAVALAGTSAAVLASANVPTTHTAPEGVASGVIHALETLLERGGFPPSAIVRVAHSTTQATNALLQGDVAPVGILAVGQGLEGRRVRSQSRLSPIELTPGRVLPLHHRYVELTGAGAVLPGERVCSVADDEALRQACSELADEGARAIVAAAAFSVDDPRLEEHVLDVVAALGLPATATSSISHLYGLAVRTRTAAINAAILPRMVQTAERTEEAVRALGIDAPVVVMRSDGGAMDIRHMKRRPILTILSGPAAGVAAALMAASVADGLFVEVGGTSTDISCIQDGHPHIRAACVGAHRLYLNTLDVRTVGVAGGSMLRLAPDGHILSVGPRSAHIAGYSYVSFPGTKPLPQKPAVVSVSPRPRDPADYLGLAPAGEEEPRWTVTPTCAANLLGLVDERDGASGDEASVKRAFAALAAHLGCSTEDAARAILDAGVEPLATTIRELLHEYGLSKGDTRLVGGGGGAGVWLGVLGKRLGLPTAIVESAPVISAVGAALALLQETVERTLVDPTPGDIARIGHEARQAVLASGAVAESVEVRVEAISQRGILRATASGSHEFVTERDVLSAHELRCRGAELLNVPGDDLACAAETRRFVVFQGRVTTSSFLGLLTATSTPWAVLDRRGRTRVQAGDGEIAPIRSENLADDLTTALERTADFGDAGMILPDAFLVTDDRIIDLCGLAALSQRVGLCRDEARPRHLAPSLSYLAVKRR